MASNVNVLLILTLAFYVSSGSLLLSSSLRPAQGLQEHHLEEHQYRQSRIPKRQNFFEENAADRWLLYEKDEDGKEGLPSFGGKRYQRFEKAGNRPPWRKRNHPDEDDSGGDTLKVSDHTSKSYASQHMLRTPRNHRTYDVPQIGECSIYFRPFALRVTRKAREVCQLFSFDRKVQRMSDERNRFF
ncbi:hypothetical protein RUM44_013344 [Polyplax serrata]|uniref:Uncharacterized protein n=1 Tax=Polyplax serrata TaxID=468196 RepID=A0ABR1BFV8_POLSC